VNGTSSLGSHTIDIGNILTSSLGLGALSIQVHTLKLYHSTRVVSTLTLADESLLAIWSPTCIYALAISRRSVHMHSLFYSPYKRLPTVLLFFLAE